MKGKQKGQRRIAKEFSYVACPERRKALSVETYILGFWSENGEEKGEERRTEKRLESKSGTPEVIRGLPSNESESGDAEDEAEQWIATMVSERRSRANRKRERAQSLIAKT